jgi:hypothetical protein
VRLLLDHLPQDSDNELVILYAAGLALAIVRSSPQHNASPPLDRESILPVMRPTSDGGSRTLSYTQMAPDRWPVVNPEESRKHISGLPPAFFV